MVLCEMEMQSLVGYSQSYGLTASNCHNCKDLIATIIIVILELDDIIVMVALSLVSKDITDS